MEITNEQLEKIKEVELDIFKKFISVCEKLNLRYYVIAGTLLGAVRHKGFIPWDDDIDVCMPRKDYELFILKGQELLTEEYFIQNFYSDPEFPANYSKIRNSNTTFLETSAKKLNINHGVFIDVFPLDFYPDDEKAQRKVEKRRKLLSVRVSTAFYFPNKKIALKAKLINLLLSLKYPSYKKAVVAREKLYKSIKGEKLVINYSGAWGKREITQADWYKEGCQLEFEGIKVYAPKEYDKWLTHVYGDYMTMPPVEKRVSHHATDVIDLEKSYIEYVCDEQK